MRKILSAIFALLFTTFTVSAQSSDQYTGSLLWKISGNGLSQPSYILGTHHLASTDFADSITGLTTAMKQTQQVAGELDLSNKLELQNRIMQVAMMPKEQSYQSLLSTTDYTTLDEGLKKVFGAGLAQMGVLKPGIIIVNLSGIAFIKAYPDFDITKHISIDEYMQTKAKEENKAVISLETVEDQIYALLESEPIATQAEQLVCGVAHFDFSVESLKELTAYYKKGQLAEMYNLSFNNPKDPCPYSEKSQNAMVRERNDKWLEKLPQIMKEKPTLIVVGALHLAGEEGLLFQLDKMGYKVEIIK